jgi:hypothetical protein
MKRLVALFVASLVCAQCLAASWTNGTQLVTNVIWVPGYHGFYSSTFHDPENCGGAANKLYLLDPAMDEKTVDRLYAMLLTAASSGKAMHVWVEGCVGTSPKVKGLQLN